MLSFSERVKLLIENALVNPVLPLPDVDTALQVRIDLYYNKQHTGHTTMLIHMEHASMQVIQTKYTHDQFFSIACQ